MDSLNLGAMEENSSLYDILELTPDATPQEIRSAYLRLKNAYSKDNIAHYTLFSKEESEETLQKIENAYLILSNPEKRRSYDQAQGHVIESPSETRSESTPTYFASAGYGLGATEPLAATSQHPSGGTTTASSPTDIEWMIQSEQDWGGDFIRRVREARRISLEDLSDYTRISRTYLHALEHEQFDKLPALVYVRGFLQQVAKRLKVPADQLMNQYMARYKAARPDKI